MMRRSLLLLLVVMLCSTLEAATNPPLPPKLVQSVAAGNQEWIDGLKARDGVRIAATYDDHAINCNAAGECVNGRAAIEAQMRERVAKMAKVEDASVSSAQTVLDGDLAYEWGSAKIRFADGKSVSGRYMTVWRVQADGSWKIFRNLSLP